MKSSKFADFILYALTVLLALFCVAMQIISILILFGDGWEHFINGY